MDAILQVLASHGKVDQCIDYADMVGRYDNVIVHNINQQQYAKALSKVSEIKNEDERYQTMYRYSSIFLNKCAKETVSELRNIRYNNIDIPKLMPAFMNIKK